MVDATWLDFASQIGGAAGGAFAGGWFVYKLLRERQDKEITNIVAFKDKEIANLTERQWQETERQDKLINEQQKVLHGFLEVYREIVVKAKNTQT